MELKDYTTEELQAELNQRKAIAKTDEEKRKREEEIERIHQKWEKEFERGRDMPTFASRW